MNFTNLLSILESKNILSSELFNRYLEYQNINLKDNEIEDLIKFTAKIFEENRDLNIFNGYYIGYKIPQISKEFDLLKITKTSVINIELKSGANEEKIKKQLIHNKYYLDSLGRDEVYNITYQSNKDEFYILNKEKELDKLEIKDLIKILLTESTLHVDLNTLFDPSEFLVSPFNNTDKFIEDKYFLTDHQNEIKKDIIKIIQENKNSFCAISGKAGTGKTLLVYDIAKETMLNKKKVLIVHCGKLNNGHIKLRNNHEIDIISIKYFTKEKINNNYDLIIIDEAQRIYQNQLSLVLNNKITNYLLSYDKTQTLSLKDGKYGQNIAGKLFEEKIKKHFTLSENIRTNKEVASFIRRFINKKEPKLEMQYKNITIQNFENIETVQDYVKNLEDNGWTYISYTPKGKGEKGLYEKYNINSKFLQNAHDVIGQEFDNVVVIVGEKFLYKETGELTYNISQDTSVPYMPQKMLFQAMTRVRKKLKIIIINNPEILERCIEILNLSK